MLKISIIKCLTDNYSYLIRDEKTNLVGIVDPSEFEAVDAEVSKSYKKLDFILNTHHHFDHVGGNQELKKKYNSKIVASKIDETRIPGINIKVNEGDHFKFGETDFEIIFIPGHTKGHIAFYSKQEKIIFTGDTLFSLGCGRIFEGTYEEMFNSLNLIKSLPKETKIYCGHEYTDKNSEFCLVYDPDNEKLKNKINENKIKLKDGLPTIPTTLEEELDMNIFLRSDKKNIQRNINLNNPTALKTFSKLRDLKDNF